MFGCQHAQEGPPSKARRPGTLGYALLSVFQAALLVAVLLASPGEFQATHWGMTKGQVRNVYPHLDWDERPGDVKPPKSRTSTPGIKVEDQTTQVEFTFLDNHLVMVLVLFQTPMGAKEERALLDKLSFKYGPPKEGSIGGSFHPTRARSHTIWSVAGTRIDFGDEESDNISSGLVENVVTLRYVDGSKLRELLGDSSL